MHPAPADAQPGVVPGGLRAARADLSQHLPDSQRPRVAPEHRQVPFADEVLPVGSEQRHLVVDVHAAPSILAELKPPGVVTGADFSGDALAATTLAGVFAYDLSDHPPRVVGFGATS